MALLSIGTGRPGSKGGGLRLIKKIRIDYFRAPSFPYVLPWASWNPPGKRVAATSITQLYKQVVRRYRRHRSRSMGFLCTGEARRRPAHSPYFGIYSWCVVLQISQVNN